MRKRSQASRVQLSQQLCLDCRPFLLLPSLFFFLRITRWRLCISHTFSPSTNWKLTTRCLLRNKDVTAVDQPYWLTQKTKEVKEFFDSQFFSPLDVLIL